MRAPTTRTRDQVANILATTSERDASTGCLRWTGPLTNAGYARITWKQPDGSIARGGHRIAYLIANGSLTPGLCIDHLCRVRHCIEPTHLEEVTHRENVMRSPIAPAAINARKTTCPQGHPYDDDNTITQSSGGRLCRTCQSYEYRILGVIA